MKRGSVSVSAILRAYQEDVRFRQLLEHTGIEAKDQLERSQQSVVVFNVSGRPQSCGRGFAAQFVKRAEDVEGEQQRRLQRSTVACRGIELEMQTLGTFRRWTFRSRSSCAAEQRQLPHLPRLEDQIH